MLKFWSVNYICQACKLYFYFGHIQNFGPYVYLSVLSKEWKCPTFNFSEINVVEPFYSKLIFCYFSRLKILVLWRKIVENFLILLHLFCPKNGAIDSTKTFITQEWLVVASCPIPRWIAFLMLYRDTFVIILLVVQELKVQNNI